MKPVMIFTRLFIISVDIIASAGFPQKLNGQLPASGPIVPELAPVQQVMTNYMATNGFQAGTIALMKNSRLVLREGYGWRDTNLTLVIHPDNLFRLASVSKPITSSAIKKLVKAGKLSTNTLVYSYLGIQPWGGVLGDSRIADITVQNLLDHSGGWNEGKSGAVFHTVTISSNMGLSYPATASDVISWVFSKPLDFTPGTTTNYSNFGYQILGRVVEKASGKSYMDYIQQDLLGSTNVIQSRSRPGDCDPWEIWHAHGTNLVQSAVDYPTNIMVTECDGGYYYESFDSFGGLSASALSLCKYMLGYWVSDGRRLPGENFNWTYTFYGALPGGRSVIYQKVNETSGTTNGLEFAALINKDQGDMSQLEDAIINATTNIVSWPTNGGGEVQWNVISTNINKNAGSITGRLIRSGLSTLPVSVSYTTYSITAGISNYVPSSGIVSFAAGETNKDIVVVLLNDGLIDPTLRFQLELISASGGAWLGSNLTCTVQILDTNPPPRFVGQSLMQTNIFRAQITSSTGLIITVQCSTDLLHWLPLQTFTNSSGSFLFTDTNFLYKSANFYRAVVP